MVLSSRFMLWNDRLLYLVIGDRSALRQLSEARMSRYHACYPQGVFGERQVHVWRSPVAAVLSGSVSVQKTRADTTPISPSYLTFPSLLFFPFLCLLNMGASIHTEMGPTTCLVLVGWYRWALP